jgi:hypothetical protein
MVQENVNNAGFNRKAIQSSNRQVTSAKAAESTSLEKTAPDWNDIAKPSGPAIPSDRGSNVTPFNESSLQDQAQAIQVKFDNLDVRFGDEDLDERVHSSFVIDETDVDSILRDRNIFAESDQIVEDTLRDTRDTTNLDFDLGVEPDQIA